MRHHLTWAALGLGAVLAFGSPASAGVLTFTLNPNGASPALGGPGSAFTADTISYNQYIYGVAQPDSSFVARRVQVVTGFSLNGIPVASPGFGLYFDVTDTGINAPPLGLTLQSSTFVLKADPGNRNGAASSTPSGFTFANTGATGEADDIVLATGSLITRTGGSIDPVTGARSANDLETFTPVAGEAGFFLAPAFGPSDFLNGVGITPPGQLILTPGPNGTSIQTINGGSFGTAQFVPEPGSLVLLGTGLLGLVLRRGRPRG